MGSSYSRLRKVEHPEPLLNEDLEMIAYSVNLGGQEIREVIERIRNPVFIMARERIFFANEDIPIDREK